MKQTLVSLLALNAFCSLCLGRVPIFLPGPKKSWFDVEDKFEPKEWLNVTSDCYAGEFYENCYIKQFQKEMSNPRLDPFLLSRLPKGDCGSEGCCIEDELCCMQDGKPSLAELKKEDISWVCMRQEPEGENLCCWPEIVLCYEFDRCAAIGEFEEREQPEDPFSGLRRRRVDEVGDEKMGAVEVIAVAVFCIFLVAICFCACFHSRQPTVDWAKRKRDWAFYERR